MRILSFFFLVFVYSTGVSAQSYLPFPDSAARWVNAGFYSGQGLTSGFYYCADGEDTVINTLSYTRMENCLTGDYLGAFRDTVGKVFYVPKDSLSESLIYDFSLQTGDTVNYYHEDFGFGANQAVIQGTDTWLVNGVNRRVLYLDASTWIEGIGCDRGFLVSHSYNVSNYSPLLYCMSVNDTIHYGYSASSSGSNVSCDFFIGLNELEKQSVEVFPNPVNYEFYFNLSGQIDAVVLTSLDGKSFVMEYSRNDSEYTVNVQGLAAGTYTLTIRSEEILYNSQVIVNGG